MKDKVVELIETEFPIKIKFEKENYLLKISKRKGIFINKEEANEQSR